MIDTAAEFARIKSLHPGAVLHQEGGKPLVLLPQFTFVADGKNETMDLLLHPSPHSGYVTRLFFERQIAARGKNWGQHRLLERMWWTLSYEKVQPDQPWTSMLINHLASVT